MAGSAALTRPMWGRCLTTICGPRLRLHSVAGISTSSRNDKDYKMVIVGGGTGGVAMANRFASKLGKNAVAVVEPSEFHYYQPMWTMVGGGLKTYEQSLGRTVDVLPSACDWIKDKALTFDPENNTVTTEGGEKLKYEYLVVGMGLQLDYHLIKGLPEALESDPSVCSNFSPKYVQKTFPAIQKLNGGNAIFTFPAKPIKCPGAPQKIAYLADDHLRKAGIRDKVNVLYNSALPVIFGVPIYAEALLKVVKDRNINVNFRHNLIEVISDKKEAVFELLEKPGEKVTFKYSMLHVSPPCSPPDVLKQSSLVDASGFVDVSKETLQHARYPNVFAIGDCTNLPTSKTAAGVAAQSKMLANTIKLVMQNKPSDSKYDGYTSCPLITKKGGCILAEFGYEGKVIETFPFNQAKERSTMYFIKAHFMPLLYWNGLLKGLWGGPALVRKILNLGMAK